MKIKKILSSILATSMVAGILAIPQTSFAYDNTTDGVSNNRAKISFEYLGKTAALDTGDPDYECLFPGTTPTTPEDLAAGDYVWVGVQVKDMSKARDLFKSDQYGTQTGGAAALTFSLTYDTEYLQPLESIVSPDDINYYAFEGTIRNDVYPSTTRRGTVYNDLYKIEEYSSQIPSFTGSEESKLTQTDMSKLKDNVQTIAINSGSGGASATGPRMFQDTATGQLGDDATIVAVYVYKVLQVPAGGRKVLQANLGGERTVMGIGHLQNEPTAPWMTNRADFGEANIKNYFDCVDASGAASDGVIDLFPAGAATKTGLTKGTKDDATACTIADQFVGKAFDKTGLNFAYTYSDSSKKDVPASDITYKWATVDTITSKSDSNLQAMPTGNWAEGDVTSTTAKKYLYAIAGDYIVCVGEMNVKSVVLSEITSVTSGVTDNSVYEGQTIDLTTLKASIKYNDNSTKENIAKADLGTYGLKIYKVSGESGSETYTEVTAADKWAKGDNKFVVANADQSIKKAFTVKAAEDTLTVTKNTAPKTSYAAGNNFDPSAMKVNYKKASQASASVVSYADFSTSGLSVVIAKDQAAAATASTADATTEITQTMIDENWHVYVVVNNGGTKSYVDMGQIGAKNINSVTVANLSTTKTYGDTLASVVGDSTSITIKYDDNSTETINKADFATKGITYKVVKSADNSVLADTTTDVLTPAMTEAGAKIAFYKDGTLLNVTTNTALTVNKKEISYNFSTTGVEKVYNATTAFETGDKVDATINKSDLVTVDQAGVTGTTAAVTGLSFAYADKNVGDAKDITVTGTAAVSTITDFAKNYTLKAATGAVADGKLVSVKGKITPATLNVTAIGNVPAINLDATTLTGTNTLVLTKDNSTMVDGDAVTLTYTYTYSASTPVGTPTVSISAGSLTAGADKDNYTLGSVVTSATGTITDISGIAVSTAPTKVTYEYNDTTLDLTGMEVTVTNGDSTTTVLTLADFFANGGTIELTDAEGNAKTLTSAADSVTLKSNATTVLTLKYKGKEATQSVTVKAQPTTGGGGGGSMIGISLDKKAVSGTVGETAKVTATIKNTKKAPTWTSANENVATVDENGNITFVGVGETTIKVAVNGVYKTINVVVTEKEVPTPTPAPTEKPVIDKEFNKPYAGGYEDGAFRPENNITRAELAAMIARLSYGDELPDGMYKTSFPDVSDDAWFNKHIGYLENLNVLTGYEDGSFRPFDTITRGEIAAVIARAQKYNIISIDSTFADVTDADWAKDYIMTLAEKEIVGGYENGTYGPYSPLTRAEAVTIINRVLAPSKAVITFTPNDIAGHWAEQAIMLAVNSRELEFIQETTPVEETEDKAEAEAETEDEVEEADSTEE